MDQFLAQISNDGLNEFRKKPIQVSSVVVEDRTEFQRRLDIVVQFRDGFQLGIENKVFGAKEQPNQISDYVDELEKRGRGQFALLFLHAEGAPCTSLDTDKRVKLEKENKFIQRSAKPFIASWLNACLRDDHRRAESVQEFLRNFSQYIDHPPEETFVDSKGTQEVVTREILKSAETVEAAFAVCAHIYSAKYAVLNGLMNKIYEKLVVRIQDPKLQSYNLAVGRSRVLWPKEVGEQPAIDPHHGLFEEGFDSNDWRYVGIECGSPISVSVDFEVGFGKRGGRFEEALGEFGATVGVHKMGEYGRDEGQKSWTRRSALKDPQEKRLSGRLAKVKGISCSIIDSNSDTEGDWYWSRNLDLSLRRLDNEAIQRFLKAWREDADPFVDQLIELMVELAKEARSTLVDAH